MYLKASLGSGVLNRMSRGLFESGMSPGGPVDKGPEAANKPSGLLALDAPGFSHRAAFFKENFGKRNDAFWNNPFGGGQMKNSSRDLPAEKKLGNYWARVLDDESVELRFYLK